MANQVDFKILPSDQFSVHSPATRSEKIITYFTLLSKLRGDILSVGGEDDPNNITSAYYTNVGGTQTLHLVKADGSEVTASNSYAGTVTSVGVSMPSAFTVANSPITTSGTIQITGAGTTAQYIRGDGTLETFPSLTGFVPYTGATQNVDLGEFQIKAGQVAFDLTPTGTAGVGIMRWNDQDGTVDLGLLGGNVTLQVGQEQVTRVVNKSGGNLTEAGYQAVKITGAQGNRLKVGLAKADNDANSADTLGLVTENINLNNEGFVTSSGLVRNIDTTGSLQGETWNDGDILYLSPNTAGAVTNIKPTAPQHTVIMGFVVRAHATQGQIYVKVDNGYELEELHDVAPTPYVNNGVLYRNTSTNLWKSATIPTVLGYTPANAAITIATTSPLSGGGDLSANRTISISQATTSTNGYLSSTDWNTFNSKEPALTKGNLTETTSSVLTITGGTGAVIGSGTTIAVSQAGASASGYLSSTDWNTFNSKASDSFKTIAVSGQSNIVADSATDTLTFEAGSNIVITTDAATDKITISATGGGTGSVTSVDMTVPTGFAISGNPITTSGTLALAFASGYSLPTNASQTNWNTAYDNSITAFAYNTSTGVLTLTQQDAGTLTATVTLAPFTTTNLAEGTNLYFTTSRARQVLSAGTGISYDNSTGVITNSAPDQTVVLTAGTGISTSGTYPSFTITNTAPDQTVVLTAGTGITTSGTYPNFTITNSDRGSSQNIFKNIAVAGQSTIVADGNDDTLTVASGTGISLTTNATSDTLTITNTAPDQTVVLTGGTGISTSGTYPNFTITNTAPDQTVVLTGAGTTVVTGTYPSFTITSNDQYVGTVTSVATSAPITGGTITSTGTIGITKSNTSTDGYLSSTDWNTFNSKVGGSGTTNYVAKFTGSSAIGNSIIYDNGTNVGIGNTSPGQKLQVDGSLLVNAGTSAASYRDIMMGGISGWATGESHGIDTVYGTAGNPTTFSRIESYFDGTNGKIRFRNLFNASAPRTDILMTITGSGSVGIGTDDPEQKFHIQGSNLMATFQNSSTSANQYTQIEFKAGSRLAYIWLGNQNTTSWAGDGGLNIYTGTGNMDFWTSGTQKVRIDTSGNVGIGTTSPSYKLHVEGTSYFTNEQTILYANAIQTMNGSSGWGLFRIYGNSNAVEMQIDAHSSNSGAATIGTYSNSDVYVKTNNANRLVVKAGGDVGIGITSPQAKLDVSGNIRITGRSGSPSSGVGMELFYYSPDDTFYIETYNYTSSQYKPINYSASSHRFLSGNVGINTTAPTQKLDVYGNIRVRNDATGLGPSIILNNGTENAGNYSQIAFGGTALSDSYLKGSLAYVTLASTYGRGDFYFLQNSAASSANAGLSDAVMVIKNSGNVGIGTTAPGAKLEIAGTSSTFALSFGNSVPNNPLFVNTYGGWSGIGMDQTTAGLRLAGDSGGNNLVDIGYYSSNVVAHANWVSRMRVLGNGNVGIGTTSPSQALDVNGYITSPRYYPYNSNSTYIAGDTGGLIIQGSGYLYVPAAGGSYFEGAVRFRGYIYNDAATYLTINGGTSNITYFAGNVGIGTTSPMGPLEVYKANTGGLGGHIILNNNGLAVGNETAVLFNDSGIGGASYVRAAISSSVEGSPNYGDLKFKTGASSYGSLNTRMIITGAGNVGIGTTAPGGNLDVRGASTTNVSYFRTDGAANRYIFNVQNIENGAQVDFRVHGSTYTETLFGNSCTNAAILLAQPASGAIFGIGNYNNGPLVLGTNNAERLRITSGGNVGIGTTSPITNLHVQGTNTEQILISYDSTKRMLLGRTAGYGWIAPYTDGVSYDNLVLARDGGNVGIGTTSPDKKLVVVGEGTGTAKIGVAGFGGGNYTGISFNGTLSESSYNILSSPTDATLYINRPSGVGIQFREANAAQMVIASGGNVGIGTTSPSYKLHVVGGTALIKSNVNNGSPILTIHTSDDLGYTFSRSNTTGFLEFDGNQTGYIGYVFKNGNVGIGTTSPSEKLHVDGNAIVTYNNSYQGINSIGNKAILARVSPTTGIINYAEYATAANLNGFVIGSDDARVKGNIATDSLEFITNTSTRMFINSSGNVGIGTTSPLYKLTLPNNTFISFNNDASNPFGIGGGDNAMTRIVMGSSSGAASSIQFGVGTSGDYSGFSSLMTIKASGNVGIGTTSPSYKLDVVGDARITSGSLGVGVAPNATDGRIDASNDIVAYSTSDSRLKENVTPIENALEKVKTLTGVEFDWKEETAHVHGYHGHDVGIIAQDVQAVLPEAVRTNESGYLSVRYEKMIALLIEGMKEQQNQIDELKAKLNGLTR